MVGTILLVLSQNFDDMLFLSCQVILEEAGNDIIVASIDKGTAKGSDTSVMTVSLKEALTQNLSYVALIVIGGSGIDEWDDLIRTMLDFQGNNKLIGLNSSVEKLLGHLNIEIEHTQAITKLNCQYFDQKE